MIAISTNMFSANEINGLFSIVDKFEVGQIGVEIFPLWHEPDFIVFLQQNLHILKDIPNSFHGAYYFTEHSAQKSTKLYTKSLENCKYTLEYAKMLNSQYMVFHHNNCFVEKHAKKDLLKYATENLAEINELAKEYAIPVLIENAGVLANQNVLLDETEFIALFDTSKNNCLLDIGHINCNQWDLENTISSLQNKIVAYHVHNNFGDKDVHNRLDSGTLDIQHFFELYQRFTPSAHIILEYSSNLGIREQDVIDDITLLQELLKNPI